jgi:hypothetical protein
MNTQHSHCSTCGYVLCWSAGRLICVRLGCAGHKQRVDAR